MNEWLINVAGNNKILNVNEYVFISFYTELFLNWAWEIIHAMDGRDIKDNGLIHGFDGNAFALSLNIIMAAHGCHSRVILRLLTERWRVRTIKGACAKVHTQTCTRKGDSAIVHVQTCTRKRAHRKVLAKTNTSERTRENMQVQICTREFKSTTCMRRRVLSSTCTQTRVLKNVH
jgi:hypothetical protein